MRRLSIMVLAGVLLVGLLAAPAAADRDPETGNLPHWSFVWLCGAEFGEPEVAEVPTGEWLDLGSGWGTATEAQRTQFLEAAIVEIERDGVPQEYTTSLFDFGDFFLARFVVFTEPGRAKVGQHWTLRPTFTEDHFDGQDIYTEGTVLECNRTVIWTPRGHFDFDG